MAIDVAPPGALHYLQEQDLDLLLSLGHRRSYSTGETLYARGERLEEIVVVEDGDVEVLLPDGGRYALRAGDIFGGAALLGGAAADETVRAANDVSAIVL